MLIVELNKVLHCLKLLKNHRSRLFSQSTHHAAAKVSWWWWWWWWRSCLLFPPLHHPRAARVWLLIPLKCWNIFRQRLPVIRPAQMGYRRRICSKRQKRTLTVRAKLRSVHPDPHPPPSSSLHPSGTVRGACSKCASQFQGQGLSLLKQHSNIHTMLTFTSKLCKFY